MCGHFNRTGALCDECQHTELHANATDSMEEVLESHHSKLTTVVRHHTVYMKHEMLHKPGMLSIFKLFSNSIQRFFHAITYSLNERLSASQPIPGLFIMTS